MYFQRQLYLVKKEFYIIGIKMKGHGLFQKTQAYKENFQALFGFQSMVQMKMIQYNW